MIEQQKLENINVNNIQINSLQKENEKLQKA